jgi:hypothetical protein
MNPMTDAELNALIASVAASQQELVEQQQRTDPPLAKTDALLNRVSRKLDRVGDISHNQGDIRMAREANDHKPARMVDRVKAANADTFARKPGSTMADIGINEQVKLYQPPLPPGVVWGEGISNEPLPAHP